MILFTRSHILLHITHFYYTICVMVCNKTFLHTIAQCVEVPDDPTSSACLEVEIIVVNMPDVACLRVLW
jgi:hypothetical protein